MPTVMRSRRSTGAWLAGLLAALSLVTASAAGQADAPTLVAQTSQNPLLVDAAGRAGGAAATARSLHEQAYQVANSAAAVHFTYPSGHRYDGQRADGAAVGLGVMTFPTGNVYAGQLQGMSRRVGHGVEYYSSGDRYEGQFVDDRREGYGIVYYTSGDYYRGQFAGDVRHGLGIYSFADGRVLSGRWASDQLAEPF